jgi:hypothetical protein
MMADLLQVATLMAGPAAILLTVRWLIIRQNRAADAER